jgi:L-aminopeptidase/D-esterase-like protein
VRVRHWRTWPGIYRPAHVPTRRWAVIGRRWRRGGGHHAPVEWVWWLAAAVAVVLVAFTLAAALAHAATADHDRTHRTTNERRGT